MAMQKNIDFLPSEYRQQHLRRQSRPWEVICVAIFVGLVGVASVAQRQHRHELEGILAAILPQYESYMSRDQQLSDVRTKTKAADGAARLITYLRHPWPRTQLLAAVLTPLPDQIVLAQLQIASETPAPQVTADTPPAAAPKPDAKQAAQLPPAEQDLKRFQDLCEKQLVLVRLSGVAHEGEALHEYLTKLGKNDLFAKVDLNSLESVPGEERGVKFGATVTVRPGYGLPGGPVGDPKQPAGRTAAAPNTPPASALPALKAPATK